MGDINAICEARRQFQLYNIPPIRYEPLSPYLEDGLGRKVTQQQLDMRRKAEILKYNKNSTQGPQLTKKQKLAAALRGNYNISRVVCPDDYKIPVLTSASGIPGPAIYLVEDRDVRLYNYIKDTAAYAENIYEDGDQWIFATEANQLCVNHNEFTPTAKLIIRKPIRQDYYRFTYSTPILFRMKATGLPASSNGITITNSIAPTALSFRATYNNSAIPNHIQLTSRFITTSSIGAKLISPTTTDTYNFFCEQYVGLLQISGIQLTTTPGFVYDFNISYILTKDTGQDNSIDALTVREKTTFELYANIDSSYVVTPSINCELVIDSNLTLPNIGDAQVTFTGTPV
jgi:hypothetical protein